MKPLRQRRGYLWATVRKIRILLILNRQFRRAVQAKEYEKALNINERLTRVGQTI